MATLFAGVNLVGVGEERKRTVIDSGYEFEKPFQRRLLTLLLREPKALSSIIKPQYFTNVLLVDIARVVTEAYEKHPDAQISQAYLREEVKASLGRHARENWPDYKKEIKLLFRLTCRDKSLLIEKARKFAREAQYRALLVEAERYVNAGKYERVHEIFEKTRSLFRDSIEGIEWKWHRLPHPSDFPYKEVRWLVEGIIPEESAIAISGEEGVGKTLFALSLAKALSDGREFLGRRVWVTPVLYLGLDVSQVTLQTYIRMMRWIPDDDFRILTTWTGEKMQPPMLDDPKGMECLYRLAKKYRPVMIFDTLRDFFEGEENSSTETKPVVDAIRRLRSLGATVIVLVHPPKSGKSLIRGTGNISQKVDIPYSLQKDTWNGKEIAVLTCPKKNRFGSTSDRLPMQMQFAQMPSGPFFRFREVVGWRPSEQWKKSDADDGVVQFVQGHPGSNQKEIQAALRMGDRTVRRSLFSARDRGLLKCVKGDRKEFCWFAADYEAETAKTGDSVDDPSIQKRLSTVWAEPKTS
jgi:archaellum biogenesis ATPase FlaH